MKSKFRKGKRYMTTKNTIIEITGRKYGSKQIIYIYDVIKAGDPSCWALMVDSFEKEDGYKSFTNDSELARQLIEVPKSK